ncbi:TPA: hypothetical protein L4741_002458 [Pseudomonas aeruginosa]|nr:hypothetical protein [Pseudomonas aeruginosa]
MYYLTNEAGRFKAVQADVNSFLMTVWEGNVGHGVSGKKELQCSSAEEAWGHVCAQVTEARSNGYSPQPIETSQLKLNLANAVVMEFALKHRGIYTRVNSCTTSQFNSGLAQLEEVVRVLIDAGFPLGFRMAGNAVEVAFNGTAIRIGIASEREWATMSPKAREIFEERGFIDSSILLPSGKGLWRLKTEESVLDVCVRAFLAELKKAGAEFEVESDAAYTLDPLRPFQRQHIEEMDWYRGAPQVLKVLENADLLGPVKMKVETVIDLGMSLFL